MILVHNIITIPYLQDCLLQEECMQPCGARPNKILKIFWRKHQQEQLNRFQVLEWYDGILEQALHSYNQLNLCPWRCNAVTQPKWTRANGSRRSISSAGCRRRRADFKDTALVLLLPPDKLHPPSSEEHRFSTQDKLRGINTISWQRRCTRIHASLLLPLRLYHTFPLSFSLCVGVTRRSGAAAINVSATQDKRW